MPINLLLMCTMALLPSLNYFPLEPLNRNCPQYLHLHELLTFLFVNYRVHWLQHLHVSYTNTHPSICLYSMSFWVEQFQCRAVYMLKLLLISIQDRTYRFLSKSDKSHSSLVTFRCLELFILLYEMFWAFLVRENLWSMKFVKTNCILGHKQITRIYSQKRHNRLQVLITNRQNSFLHSSPPPLLIKFQC